MQAHTPAATPASASNAPRSAALPLAALAVGSFGIGTTEFGPMGMLLGIAQGVDVSVPSAGLLVSGYAIGVTIGAPITTLLLSRWPRRTALMVLMAIFAIGNLLSALAPGYVSLMAARVFTSLAHGGFFGIGAVVAASLVPRDKQASAVAVMFAGLTVANIGGVPAATWLSDALGWRESFGAIAALGLLAMVALRAALPAEQHHERVRTNVRAELRVIARPVVVLGILVTIVNSGAMFALYTYINPALREFANASPGTITLMLALVGVGFTVGNHLGGKLSDRSITKTLVGFLVLEIASMLALPHLAQTLPGAALGLFIWAIAAFGLVPPIQMQVMRAAHEAPGLASSINIGAFNLGNAVGAAVGALLLSHGFGYAEVIYGGAALALVALGVVGWGSWRETRGGARVGAAQGC